MKKILVAATAAAALCSAPALAADMPVKGTAYKAAPSDPWTGCYLGANAGYGWAKSTFTSPGGILVNDYSSDGGVVGGQVGCDYQVGAWVFGIQGLFDWSDISNRLHAEGPGPAFGDKTNIHSFATLTGRLGYTIQPATLLYAKGGAAWLKGNYFDDLFVGGLATSSRLSRNGWTIGGGIEVKFAPNWSWFVEYDYMNFGTKTQNFTPVAFITNAKQDLNVVLVGLNYRFGH